MDKPQSLSMREYLIRKLAPKLLMSEKVIDAVIVHQFSEANAAMHIHDSVEISGFGKFFFNKKKAERKLGGLLIKEKNLLEMLESGTLTEAKKQSATTTLANNKLSIETLKSKLND